LYLYHWEKLAQIFTGARVYQTPGKQETSASIYQDSLNVLDVQNNDSIRFNPLELASNESRVPSVLAEKASGTSEASSE
jgi:hypothetical protein